jgi:hypothetical protein
MNNKPPRLIYCQRCGESQVVEGTVLPCLTCGGGEFKTTKLARPRTWDTRLSAWDRRFLKARRIGAGSATAQTTDADPEC